MSSVNLPYEIWDKIISYLTYKEASKIRIVSRYFDEVVRNNNKIHQQFLSSEILASSEFYLETNGQRLFKDLCKTEYLDLIRWAARKYNITREHILENNTEMFNNSCVHDNFEVAKWLITTFKLKKKDIRAGNDSALRYIGGCNSNLEFLQWIMKRFRIKPAEHKEFASGNRCTNGKNKSIFKDILDLSISYGKSNVAKWLFENWPFLRPLVKRSTVKLGIKRLVKYKTVVKTGNGKAQLTSYSFNDFKNFMEGLTDLKRYIILDALKFIFKYRNLNYIISFLNYFSVSKDEFLNYFPLLEVCKRGKIEILKYLVGRYNFDYETSPQNVKEKFEECLFLMKNYKEKYYGDKRVDKEGCFKILKWLHKLKVRNEYDLIIM